MHQALDGDGPQPLRLLVSVVCREFSCEPSRAMWEIEHNSEMVAQVLDVRAYERAKAEVDRLIAADRESELPQSDLIQEVLENRFDRNARIYAEKKARQAQRLAGQQGGS